MGIAPKLGTAVMSLSRKFLSEHEDEREPTLGNPVISVEASGEELQANPYRVSHSVLSSLLFFFFYPREREVPAFDHITVL